MEDAFVDGQTGMLTMDDTGSVHREQLWARFQNGTPDLLEPRTRRAEEVEEPATPERILENMRE
jgi:hypothetical protein